MIEAPINEAALKNGFSILHAYIRFMELVLHVSYRIELKKWRVRDALLIQAISF